MVFSPFDCFDPTGQSNLITVVGKTRMYAWGWELGSILPSSDVHLPPPSTNLGRIFSQLASLVLQFHAKKGDREWKMARREISTGVDQLKAKPRGYFPAFLNSVESQRGKGAEARGQGSRSVIVLFRKAELRGWKNYVQYKGRESCV